MCSCFAASFGVRVVVMSSGPAVFLREGGGDTSLAGQPLATPIVGVARGWPARLGGYLDSMTFPARLISPDQFKDAIHMNDCNLIGQFKSPL